MAESTSSTDQFRLMIWSPPRSLSTAFARSMSARGDTKVFWEPYTAAYHFGPDRKLHWTDDIPSLNNERYTFSYVKDSIESSHPNSRILFAKCMVEAISWNYDVVAGGYKHSFLIRDPLQMYRSYEKLSANLPLDFKATYMHIYQETEAFYHHVITKLGQSAPPILDADDLQQQPDKVLPKYCDAMGIPYTPNMLHWEPVKTHTSLNWEFTDVGVFGNEKYSPFAFSHAFASTGFGGGSSNENKGIFTADVLECANHAMPVYKRLHELRIKP